LLTALGGEVEDSDEEAVAVLATAETVLVGPDAVTGGVASATTAEGTESVVDDCEVVAVAPAVAVEAAEAECGAAVGGRERGLPAGKSKSCAVDARSDGDSAPTGEVVPDGEVAGDAAPVPAAVLLPLRSASEAMGRAGLGATELDALPPLPMPAAAAIASARISAAAAAAIAARVAS
jgi:hypothetical protein